VKISLSTRRFGLLVTCIQATVLLLGAVQTTFEASAAFTVVTLVYLLFVPGAVMLRIFRIDRLELAESLLYAVGVSVAFDMAIGLSLTIFGPTLGIQSPMSQTPIIWTAISIVTIGVAFLLFRERNFPTQVGIPVTIRTVPMLPPWCIGLAFLIVALGVAGSLALNVFGSGLISATLFIVLAGVPILVTRLKANGGVCATMIFSASLGLLYHRSLVSDYITGWDIQSEFHTAHQVVLKGIAQLDVVSTVASTLSTSVFAPLLAVTTGLPLVGVFKLVYPVLYALAATGLFVYFNRMFGPIIGFLSSYLVISTFVFYQVMLDLPRQQLAELFVVLFLLATSSRGLDKTRRVVLATVFSTSIIVSHYALSYIFAFVLLSYLAYGRISRRFPESWAISWPSLVTYSVSLVAWYSYVARSFVISVLIQIIDQVSHAILTDFLSPSASQPLAIATSRFAPIHQITALFYLTVAMLMGVGILWILVRRRDLAQSNWMGFSMAGILLLISATILPYVASQLNFNRFFQLSLLLSGPLAALALTKIGVRNETTSSKRIKLLAIFVGLLLLFSSGVVYEIAGEPPESMSLDGRVDYPRFTSAEIAAAVWLESHASDFASIYSDVYRGLLIVGVMGVNPTPLTTGFDVPNGTVYVFLGRWNLDRGEIVVYDFTRNGIVARHVAFADTQLARSLALMSPVFRNSDAEILASPLA